MAHSRKERNTLFPKKAELFKQTNNSSEQALFSKETKLGPTDPISSRNSCATSACPLSFSHHIPLLDCHSPSTLRARISKAMWQHKATFASSQSSKRNLCVRTAPMKKCLRFQSMTPRRCPSQGFLGNRISTCLRSQETSCTFCCQKVQNNQRTRLEREETKGLLNGSAFVRATGSILIRKKKSFRCSSHKSRRFFLFCPRYLLCELDHNSPHSCPRPLSFPREL